MRTSREVGTTGGEAGRVDKVVLARAVVPTRTSVYGRRPQRTAHQLALSAKPERLGHRQVSSETVLAPDHIHPPDQRFRDEDVADRRDEAGGRPIGPFMHRLLCGLYQRRWPGHRNQLWKR